MSTKKKCWSFKISSITKFSGLKINSFNNNSFLLEGVIFFRSKLLSKFSWKLGLILFGDGKRKYQPWPRKRVTSWKHQEIINWISGQSPASTLMPKLPRKVSGSTGQSIFLNGLRDYAKSLTPRRSPNTLTRHGLNGVVRKSKPGGQQSTPSSEFVWL